METNLSPLGPLPPPAAGQELAWALPAGTNKMSVASAITLDEVTVHKLKNVSKKIELNDGP